MPRVNDKRVDPETGERQRFSSAILPPWARKTPKITEVLPLLYLHGLSSGDFVPGAGPVPRLGEGLVGLGGDEADRAVDRPSSGRSPPRDLSEVDFVYLWADGIHVNIRLEEHKLCLLVMIGVRADGRKELVALADGYRESTESWADLLRDCKRRGMRAPILAAGDGALGFWGALREVFPETREQRCWFHKIGNVLAALPKSAHPGAKKALAEIWNAEDKQTRPGAVKAFERRLRREVPQSRRQDHRRRRGATGVLRLPGRALACTSVPPTRSSPPSPPSGTAPRSPKAPAPARPASRWPSSSSSPPRPAGARSTHPTSSPSSAPAPASRTANSSNDPTNTPRHQPPKRSSSTGLDDFSLRVRPRCIWVRRSCCWFRVRVCCTSR